MKFLVRKAPENFIRTVNDEISSLLNRHFDSYFPEAAYWEDMDKFSMPVEISDKGKDYEVKAELPGVKKEDLDIDIDKNHITINAKKEERKPRHLTDVDFLLGVYDETRMGGLRFSVMKDGPFLSDDKELATPPWTTLRKLESASLAFEKNEDGMEEKWLKQ